MAEQKPTNNAKTYNKITEVVKDIDKDSKEIHLLLGIVDYDAPYLLHYDMSLHLPPYCDAKHKIYDFLNRVDMLHEITLLEQRK